MKQVPTKSEVSEVYNSIMRASAQCKAIYGTDSEIICKVLRFWGNLGLLKLEKIESEKYEPRMKAPTFPIYDENCNIIG